MQRKGGAIIIGIEHEGKENADRVIHALIENEIKRGDLVAVEDSPQEVEKIKKEIAEGWTAFLIQDFTKRLRETERGIRSCGDKKELKELKRVRRVYANIVGELNFYYRFYGFLFSKRAKILAFGSEAMGEKARFMKANTWKKKLIREFIALPIREGHFRRQLQGKSPRFVLIGAGHLAAAKRMLPYEKVVNLEKTFFAKKTAGRIRDEFIMASYRAIKRYTRARRRRLLQKRRPAGK